MISENLLGLRKRAGLSQEEIAEQIGVSRQTVAKWETGDSVPDVLHCNELAELFDVTLDNLVNFDWTQGEPAGMPPRGKYLFGAVTVGEKGQIVIPVKARRIFDIKAGDSLMVLGDIEQGLALMKSEFFLEAFQKMQGLEGKDE